jgi:glycosyltransferase involved in cell wall biosynthesis
MVEQISARGVPKTKIGLIPNWCDETVFKPKRRNIGLQTALGLPNGFTVMYAGAIGEVQGLDIVIEAADLLRSRSEINFVLVGSGVARDRLMWEAAQRKLSNINFVPAQPISAMGDVLALGDVQLICLRDLPLYRITLPSKVQATMAAGRPLIVSAGGDAAKVVADARAGISVPPGSAGSLAKAVLATFEAGETRRCTWGKSARDHYLSKYSERVGVAAMLDALTRASDNRGVAKC